jgi:hypothetical protein
MSYKLFIDDERFPPGSQHQWIIARSSEEAIRIVDTLGMPEFISFDHDLGGEDTSIVFVKWMIEWVLDCIEQGCEDKIKLDYYVHSQNPVGVKNIEGLMESFLKFIDDRRIK